MTKGRIQTELLEQMQKLSPAMQQQVLGYAHSLGLSNLASFPGSELLQFAGIMSPEEAKEFLQSIDEDCERLDSVTDLNV